MLENLQVDHSAGMVPENVFPLKVEDSARVGEHTGGRGPENARSNGGTIEGEIEVHDRWGQSTFKSVVLKGELTTGASNRDDSGLN